MALDPRIKTEYMAKKRRAEAERDARVAALYQALPRLKAIEAEERERIFAIGRGGDREALEGELQALRAERQALLRQQGVEQALFTPAYECPLCQDTGYVEGLMCRCLKRRIAEGFQEDARSGLGFADFDEAIYPSERQRRRAVRIRDYCQAYAESFPENQPKGILLMGQAGLGKSFLLGCIQKRVRERGYSAVKLTAYRLINQVLSSIKARELPNDYLLPDLLIIDDLGVEPLMDKITVENLFLILNERQAEDKATLFATNLTPPLLEERYGERMFSRLLSNRLFMAILMEGEDLRLKH